MSVCFDVHGTVKDLHSSIRRKGQMSVRDGVPAKGLGEAWEIAEAVLFLAAPSGGYITAQTLVVDGGMIG